MVLYCTVLYMRKTSSVYEQENISMSIALPRAEPSSTFNHLADEEKCASNLGRLQILSITAANMHAKLALQDQFISQTDKIGNLYTVPIKCLVAPPAVYQELQSHLTH